LFHSRNAFKVHDQDTLDYGFIVFFYQPEWMPSITMMQGLASEAGMDGTIELIGRHVTMRLSLS